MKASVFLEKFDAEKLGFISGVEDNKLLGNHIVQLQPYSMDDELRSADIALIGVNEARHALNNEGCEMAPNQIRKYLYNLTPVHKNLKIVDLGNIKQGAHLSDTYFALKAVVAELLLEDVIPIVIGGGQDLTYPIYLAFESLERIINLVAIDSRFDQVLNTEEPDSQSYLSHIIMRNPSFLFNYANIGYQTHFVNQDDLKLFDNLFFDAYRLGSVRSDLPEAEPILRNADMLTFDISAIRQSDAPGNGNASPNGFFGDEACQLMRYAGLAERLSCIGFFETNPLLDHNGQTVHLVAQLIWYFLEGFTLRSNDFPTEKSEGFIKYTATQPGLNNDMIFYKSKLTDRWWMQLPVSNDKADTLSRHVMIPCSYNDYLKAVKSEVPDRWWKAYQKLM
jgi:formiminoglutamase